MRLLFYTEDSSVAWLEDMLSKIGVEIVQCNERNINKRLNEVEGIFLELNGLTDRLTKEIKEMRSNTNRFILVAIPYNEEWLEILADLGVDDVIFKPINPCELIGVIEHMILVRRFHEAKMCRMMKQISIVRLQQREIARYMKEEENLVCELETLRKEKEVLAQELLAVVSKVIELKDYEIHTHTQRVGRISALIAEKMGSSQVFVELLEKAAPLHDMGKVFVPEAILLKRGKLTDEEFEIMKLHTIFGYELLKGSRSPVLSLAAEVSLYHHERWNGKGYPHGLKGDEIPLSAQIVAVADSLDAMVSHRPYKAKKSFDEAAEEIRNLSGISYSPDVVEAFTGVIDEIRELYDWELKRDGIISNSNHHRKGGTRRGENKGHESHRRTRW
ncbi:HD domain-containing phosphohydrolase [Thermotoga sp.]|uniref:HD-GYP domain-containing protein n=1 Tax=Thermotoga sp. TaxID=28240 RepID=UPI0025D9389A|nr:HD domain-containing phosphohydrolase [Thermotoga sp.]MCD6551280.1 HD domain-containing protein [Thermotoga sp.]